MCCENCCTSEATSRDEFGSQIESVYVELDALRHEREEVRRDIYLRISQDEARLVDLEDHLRRELSMLWERLIDLEDHVKFGTKPR